MEKFQFVLFQLDRAKTFLQEESLPAIRVAIILIDNAVEILLDRLIEGNMELEDIYERIRINALNAGAPRDLPELKHLFERRYFKANDKKKMARFFDEKVIYATRIKKVIPQYFGKVLSHLHRYRNLAFHSSIVKPEIIRTFIIIYFELCCRLLERIPKYIGNYSVSAEVTNWIKTHFGTAILELDFSKILVNLRSGFSLNREPLQKTLGQNLVSA